MVCQARDTTELRRGAIKPQKAAKYLKGLPQNPVN
jgi:hypothetical protein